jgi:hypothetical protein
VNRSALDWNCRTRLASHLRRCPAAKLVAERARASCLMLWLDAEPNVDPAFIVVVDESPPNKVDSAAAWAKAEESQASRFSGAPPELCRNLHPRVSAMSASKGSLTQLRVRSTLFDTNESAGMPASDLDRWGRFETMLWMDQHGESE